MDKLKNNSSLDIFFFFYAALQTFAKQVSISLASVIIWRRTRGSSSPAWIIHLAIPSINPAPYPVFIRIAATDLCGRTSN